MPEGYVGRNLVFFFNPGIRTSVSNRNGPAIQRINSALLRQRKRRKKGLHTTAAGRGRRQ